jgi:hypothetical protein
MMEKVDAERLWDILKQQNCADPENAARIVLLDKKAFFRAVKSSWVTRELMPPWDQLCHDMVGGMCCALQYMKNAVEVPDRLPIRAESVKLVHDDFTKLIERYHELRAAKE